MIRVPEVNIGSELEAKWVIPDAWEISDSDELVYFEISGHAYYGAYDWNWKEYQS